LAGFLKEKEKMETRVSKRVGFFTIISIVVAVTSLFYVISSIVYFVAMGLSLNGNEYDKLGFLFGLIGLPVAVVALAVPVVRIITLILSINLGNKVKAGSKAGGLCVAAGILQIVDAVISPVIFSIVGTILYVLGLDAFQGLETLYALMGFAAGAIVLAKCAAQIVASIFLFKCKPELS
jgi:hypothetical protein